MNNEEKDIKYTPIYYDNGTIAYTPEQINLIVNDYLQKAEQSIEKARNKKMYSPGNKTDIEQMSDEKKFVLMVKEKGDYDWVINIVLSRNQLDPLQALRTKIYTIVPGGATIDIMIKHINDVMRDIHSSYVDRARAKDYIKFIEDISKKHYQDSSSMNFGFAFQLNNNNQEPTKVQTTDTPVKGLKRVKDTEAVEQ